MVPLLENERQQQLKLVIDEALNNTNLKEALETFEISQNEFVRAIINTVPIQISSGNTTNQNLTRVF